MFAHKVADDWIAIAAAFTVGEGDDAIQYPANWPELATPEERAAIGVAEIVEAGPSPTDVLILDQVIADVDGVPTRVWQTEPYPLAAAQALAWSRAQAVQATHAWGGCMTPVGRVQTDKDSQGIIQGMVLAVLTCNLLQQPFPGVTFTMADNSRVPLDAQQVAAVSIAVVTYLDQCKEVGEAIRAAIYAAETPEAVFAVDIDAGYPAN